MAARLPRRCETSLGFGLSVRSLPRVRSPGRPTLGFRVERRWRLGMDESMSADEISFLRLRRTDSISAGLVCAIARDTLLAMSHRLTQLWRDQPDFLANKSFRQIIQISGDGRLRDSGETSGEVRDWLSVIPLNRLRS